MLRSSSSTLSVGLSLGTGIRRGSKLKDTLQPPVAALVSELWVISTPPLLSLLRSPHLQLSPLLVSVTSSVTLPKSSFLRDLSPTNHPFLGPFSQFIELGRKYQDGDVLGRGGRIFFHYVEVTCYPASCLPTVPFIVESKRCPHFHMSSGQDL